MLQSPRSEDVVQKPLQPVGGLPELGIEFERTKTNISCEWSRTGKPMTSIPVPLVLRERKTCTTFNRLI